MNRVAQRRIRIVEVETATPSPFAASLLFGYVGAFMYEGDSPLAERRAAALSLDSDAAGRAARPGRAARTARPAGHRSRPIAQLQHLTAGPRGARRRGGGRPAAAARPADRGRDRRAVPTAADVGGWLDGLRAARRALTVSFAGADVVGRHRGRRAAARRRRRRRAGRRARRASPSRSPIRSASCSAGTPAPTGRSPPPTRPRTVRPGSAGDRRRAGPDGGRRQAGARRVHRRRRQRTVVRHRRVCRSCADGRWPRCGPRSNR